jgi:hypothetical protein
MSADILYKFEICLGSDNTTEHYTPGILNPIGFVDGMTLTLIKGTAYFIIN